MSFLQKIGLGIWGAIALGVLGYYVYAPEFFAPANLAQLLRQAGAYALLSYGLVSAFRIFTLVPATPLVIAGGLLFADSFWLAYVLSVSGALVSATLVYYFAEFLGIAAWVRERNHPLTRRLQRQLSQPSGFWWMLLWSVLPIAPTDLMCYVAGAVRVSYFRFFLAALLGQLVINWVYLQAGAALR
ncbi:TVP38/TMEM64 family protein [Eisenibacter elegans]|uniref:TVP38/TMEM64 family protein n=1 Tax=Eisenibacter elegans TaxID=997 RepID=UPI0003F66220|nr:VTT domain-containing protein [Eisenibacter elegans]